MFQYTGTSVSICCSGLIQSQGGLKALDIRREEKLPYKIVVFSIPPDRMVILICDYTEDDEMALVQALNVLDADPKRVNIHGAARLSFAREGQFELLPPLFPDLTKPLKQGIELKVSAQIEEHLNIE